MSKNNQQKEDEKTQHLFILAKPSPENRKETYQFLAKLGVRITIQHSEQAMEGVATPEMANEARTRELFMGVYSKPINRENLKNLSKELQLIGKQWNFTFTRAYKKQRDDMTHVGKKWVTRGLAEPRPYSLYDPQFFKEELLKRLEKEEKELLKEYADKVKKTPKSKRARFKEFERNLAKKFKDETIGYYLARIVQQLSPHYYYVIIDYWELVKDFFPPPEPECWKLENEISVGVVFVESSQTGGPTFTSSERTSIRQEIIDGLNWLANSESKAGISWVIDWQYETIDVANGTGNPSEEYWRNPAMEQVNYFDNTYTGDWNGISNYRENMRTRNRSSHAVVIFVTPYANVWFGYAGTHRITLAENGGGYSNWGNWGIPNLDAITAHEMCHLFGAVDEYTGTGTPCSSCGGQYGCYKIPNGNCGACASPFQDCLMDANIRRICAYTQGHIGWADLFVELKTADVAMAGTNDDVWLDIGDRVFELDTPDHDDRERGNIEGYALNYSGVIKNHIKRVGIRKSPDGRSGGWKLARVKVWCRGELICSNSVNKWLEDNKRWWVAPTCGIGGGIVNTIRVHITTADEMWAGTDDDVRIYLGGRSWNLDNPWRNDFERGRTDTFDLDPRQGLYESSITSVRIHKSPDGLAGGWKLKGVRIRINGVDIYSNQSINRWLEDRNRDWQDSI